MLSKNVSASELRGMIETKYPNDHMAFKDLFALGCFLHKNGQIRAGRKAVDQVLSAVRVDGNEGYLASILGNLEGNEPRFADEIFAHLEINNLFK